MAVTSSSPSGKRPSLREMVRALGHRNYRLFFFGQGISLLGTWTQRTAMGLLVYRLTNSEMLLGVVGFSGSILAVVFAPVAGVLADRMDKQKLLIITQAVSMLQAAALAILTLGHWISVPQIIVLSAILGLANAFDIPIRQAFQIEMIDRREDLPNAIALNSFLFNGSRLVGPAVAGILIALVGEGICFLINAVSFVAVLASLLAIHVPPRQVVRHEVHPLRTLQEGFQYAFGFAPIRSILILLALSGIMGMSMGTLMPVFATDILSQDMRHLLGAAQSHYSQPQIAALVQGLLMSTSGLGAVFGTIYLASRRSPQGLGVVIAAGCILNGITSIIFGLSSLLWVSILAGAMAGFGAMIHHVSSNTILQTIVDDSKRGRVMSFYTMAIMGMMPFGNLLSGWMAHTRLGAPMTVAILGFGSAISGVLFATWLPKLGPLVRPVYIQKGVIADLAETDPEYLPSQTFRM